MRSTVARAATRVSGRVYKTAIELGRQAALIEECNSLPNRPGRLPNSAHMLPIAGRAGSRKSKPGADPVFVESAPTTTKAALRRLSGSDQM